MAQERSKLKEIIETLQRQRVRQGDFDGVLDCILGQAALLEQVEPGGPFAELALQMRARALEIRRYKASIPKFVVEDLLEEALARLSEQP